MVKWQRRSRSLFTKLDAKHSKHVQIALKKFLISEKVWIWQYRLHDEVCFKPLEQGEGGFNSCGIIIMIMETRDLCNSWLFQQVQALGGGRNLDYLRHYLFENGVSSYKSGFLRYFNLQECIPSSTRVYSSEMRFASIIIISAIEAAPQDNAIFKICHYGFQQTSFCST